MVFFQTRSRLQRQCYVRSIDRVVTFNTPDSSVPFGPNRGYTCSQDTSQMYQCNHSGDQEPWRLIGSHEIPVKTIGPIGPSNKTGLFQMQSQHISGRAFIKHTTKSGCKDNRLQRDECQKDRHPKCNHFFEKTVKFVPTNVCFKQCSETDLIRKGFIRCFNCSTKIRSPRQESAGPTCWLRRLKATLPHWWHFGGHRQASRKEVEQFLALMALQSWFRFLVAPIYENCWVSHEFGGLKWPRQRISGLQ